MEVFYNNKKIINNQFLSTNKTQDEPTLIFHFSQKLLYTLIMYDPDAVNGTFIHWLVTNIKSGIHSGDTILSYKGPSPPPKTSKHRYIFELWEQTPIKNDYNTKERYTNNIKKIKTQLDLGKLISKIQFISQNKIGGKKTNKKRKINKIKQNITKKNKTIKYN